MWKRPETAAQDLLGDVAGDEWGQVAVSVYDTARLVALAPWLAGHEARLEYLCHQQRADGSWGGPGGYNVVPTLSATAALLAQVQSDMRQDERDRLTRVARSGLEALRRILDPASGTEIPDTIGVELIVPALVAQLREHADLAMPRGFDPAILGAARARLDAGALPRRAWACLEVFGEAAVAAASVRPAGGAVGCSAAATAAWAGGPAGDPDAVGFLTRLQERGGGPVPGVTPIAFFEPAWVLNSLAVAGLAYQVPDEIVKRLEQALTATGAPAAPGLPPDADDTAAVLAALLRHGRVPPPDSLLGYQVGDHFACFLDERNPSVSTNAHVLEAFALHERTRFAAPAAIAARWLLDQQEPDGNWQDKWHASAYYATSCCVLALHLHGGAGSRAAIDRAVAWTVETQRPEGSWGRWQGTVEETAYAVQILALCGADASATTAIKRGCAFLADPPPLAEHPPLWHAKDLYLPVAVVQAARVAALHLGVRVQHHPWPQPRPQASGRAGSQ